MAFFTETGVAGREYLYPAYSAPTLYSYHLCSGFDAWNLGTLCRLHPQRPTPSASTALAGVGRISWSVGQEIKGCSRVAKSYSSSTS